LCSRQTFCAGGRSCAKPVSTLTRSVNATISASLAALSRDRKSGGSITPSLESPPSGNPPFERSESVRRRGLSNYAKTALFQVDRSVTLYGLIARLGLRAGDGSVSQNYTFFRALTALAVACSLAAAAPVRAQVPDWRRVFPQSDPYTRVFPNGRPPADPRFQQFGSFSFDCEEAGGTRQVRVEIDAQRDVPTISFLEGGDVKLRKSIERYAATVDFETDRFGQNGRPMAKFRAALWNDGGQFLSMLAYSTSGWLMTIDMPGHNRAEAWVCLPSGPTPAYECTLRGVGYSVTCDPSPLDTPSTTNP